MKTLICLFLFFPLVTLSQPNKLDSLKTLLQQEKVDTIRARLLIEMGDKLVGSSPDSAILIYSKVKEFKDNSEKLQLLKAIANSKIAYVEVAIKGQAVLAVQKIDSVINVFNRLKQSSNKLISISAKKELCGSYNHLGSSMRVQGKYKDALTHYLTALKIAKEIHNNTDVLEMCYLNLGNIYRYLGQLDSAKYYNFEVLALNQKKGKNSNLSMVYNNIGNVFHMQGDYSKALEYYQQALTIFEEKNDKSRMGSVNYNIGTIHLYTKNFKLAIDYYSRALAIRQEIGDKKGILNTLMAMGQVFSENTNDYDKALEYFQKALSIATEIGDKSGTGHSYLGISSVLKYKKKFNEALAYTENALNLFKQTSNPNGQISATNDMALIYYKLENYSKSYEFAIKSYKQAKSINILDQQVTASSLVKDAAAALGNLNVALEYANICLELSDSLNNENKTKAIAEMEARFQNEKKQQEIEKQKIVIEKQEIENRQRSNQRNFLFAGSILLALLAFVSLWGYQQKSRRNKMMALANSELEQANSEISAQRDEIETQRDMVMSQRDKLEEINSHMTNGLRYARSIQAAILPSEKVLKEISSDYFVFMKPCELVSGDFFWATTFNEFRIFCVADCTGHGVPGAFMSILGITALNDIVARHRVTNPAEILGYLRESVIDALNQNDPENIHKDGMDIALCVFNSKTRELQYAGARLPLIVVKCEESNDVEIKSSYKPLYFNERSLHEIKGDIAPVGQSPRMGDFTNHSMHLSRSNVCLYLITDGFSDQLGGNPKSKFGIARLRNLILENASRDFSEQSKIIEKIFEDWKGANYQVDDTTILGIKL